MTAKDCGHELPKHAEMWRSPVTTRDCLSEHTAFLGLTAAEQRAGELYRDGVPASIADIVNDFCLASVEAQHMADIAAHKLGLSHLGCLTWSGFLPATLLWREVRWNLVMMDEPNPWTPIAKMYGLGVMPVGYADFVFPSVPAFVVWKPR